MKTNNEITEAQVAAFLLAQLGEEVGGYKLSSVSLAVIVGTNGTPFISASVCVEGDFKAGCGNTLDSCKNDLLKRHGAKKSPAEEAAELRKQADALLAKADKLAEATK